MNKKLNVTGIEYHDLIPRTTLCHVVGAKESYGVAIRSSRDKENLEIGNTIAFVRSLNSL